MFRLRRAFSTTSLRSIRCSWLSNLFQAIEGGRKRNRENLIHLSKKIFLIIIKPKLKRSRCHYVFQASSQLLSRPVWNRLIYWFHEFQHISFPHWSYTATTCFLISSELRVSNSVYWSCGCPTRIAYGHVKLRHFNLIYLPPYCEQDINTYICFTDAILVKEYPCMLPVQFVLHRSSMFNNATLLYECLEPIISNAGLFSNALLRGHISFLYLISISCGRHKLNFRPRQCVVQWLGLHSLGTEIREMRKLKEIPSPRCSEYHFNPRSSHFQLLQLPQCNRAVGSLFSRPAAYSCSQAVWLAMMHHLEYPLDTGRG